MKLPRRQFLHLAAGAVALPAVSRIAQAQGYPTRPVRVIVGFPAGGPSDILARLICVARQRSGDPLVRRAVQDDDRREHGSRAISRQCSGAD